LAAFLSMNPRITYATFFIWKNMYLYWEELRLLTNELPNVKDVELREHTLRIVLSRHTAVF
jgi:hypothetical protein